MKRLLLPSISLSKTTTKTMTNSMSLWLCTNNPTSLPLDPPPTIFFRIPQFPIEKSLSYTRVISYIHHDKNGGSCNFLAKKNKLPITSCRCCGGNNSLNSNYSLKLKLYIQQFWGVLNFQVLPSFDRPRFPIRLWIIIFQREIWRFIFPLFSRAISRIILKLFSRGKVYVQCAQKY